MPNLQIYVDTIIIEEKNFNVNYYFLRDCAISPIMKGEEGHKQGTWEKMGWATFQKIDNYPRWEKAAGFTPLLRAPNLNRPQLGHFLACSGRFFTTDLLHNPAAGWWSTTHYAT